MSRHLILALVLVAVAIPLRAEDAEPAAKTEPPAAAAGAPTDDAVLAAARFADLEYQTHFALVLSDLDNPVQEKRILAIREIGHLQETSAAPRLVELLEPGDVPIPVILASCESLADIGAATAVPLMVRLLGHNDPQVRAMAQKSLTRLQSMGAGMYQGRGKDTDNALRGSAVTSLGALKHAEAAPILIAALRYDDRTHIRRMAAISLGKLGDPSNATPLIDALCDGDPGVRRYAAESLVRLQAVQAIPYLIIALEANIAPTHLNRCLRILSGQDFGFDPRGNILDRTEAIERWNDWWALNAKSLTGK